MQVKVLELRVMRIFTVVLLEILLIESTENSTVSKELLGRENYINTPYSKSFSNLHRSCSESSRDVLCKIIFTSALKRRKRSPRDRQDSCKNRNFTTSHYNNECLRTFTQYTKKSCTNTNSRLTIKDWPHAQVNCSRCLFRRRNESEIHHLENNESLIVSPISTIIYIWENTTMSTSSLESGSWKKIKVTLGYYCRSPTKELASRSTAESNREESVTINQSNNETDNKEYCSNRNFSLELHHKKYNSCRNTFTQYTKHSCRNRNSGLMIHDDIPSAKITCNFCLVPQGIKDNERLIQKSDKLVSAPISTIVLIWDSQALNLETMKRGQWKKLKITIGYYCATANTENN